MWDLIKLGILIFIILYLIGYISEKRDERRERKIMRHKVNVRILEERNRAWDRKIERLMKEETADK